MKDERVHSYANSLTGGPAGNGPWNCSAGSTAKQGARTGAGDLNACSTAKDGPKRTSAGPGARKARPRCRRRRRVNHFSERWALKCFVFN